MNMTRLKQYFPVMPKGLYARAALILILPVFVLQLIVGIVFIRRDLADITSQMTNTMVRELNLLVEEAEMASSQSQALEILAPIISALNFEFRFLTQDETIPETKIGWDVLSGYAVRDTLRDNFDAYRSLVMERGRLVSVVFATEQGPAEVQFNRRRVTLAAPHQLIVIMLVFGILLVSISFMYMRNQLRPIKRLSRAAEAFGRGHMIPYSPRGATEVRAAGAAFVNMRQRIERQIEQRTLMLSGVSHDLRTPLTRLKLELSMMETQDAQAMLRDVDEMQALVDSFLDFSRGVSTSEMELCDPQVLIEEAVERWQAQGKTVHLTEVFGAREVHLRKVALMRAVDNLISNAVRYGTRARVSLTLTEKALRIRVEDDGPGIPVEMRGDAMRPFVRLDPARNQDAGAGVGLGLAIVADIARAHGGALRLGRSDALGGLQADIMLAL